MKLADGTNVLAKARTLKESIDDKRDKEETQYEPRRPRRLVPKPERLVCPEEKHEQCDRQPFRAQRARPLPSLDTEPSAQFARQHEWTRHTEKIARHQKCNHRQPAPVIPRQDARKIA